MIPASTHLISALLNRGYNINVRVQAGTDLAYLISEFYSIDDIFIGDELNPSFSHLDKIEGFSSELDNLTLATVEAIKYQVVEYNINQEDELIHAVNNACVCALFGDTFQEVFVGKYDSNKVDTYNQCKNELHLALKTKPHLINDGYRKLVEAAYAWYEIFTPNEEVTLTINTQGSQSVLDSMSELLPKDAEQVNLTNAEIETIMLFPEYADTQKRLELLTYSRQEGKPELISLDLLAWVSVEQECEINNIL